MTIAELLEKTKEKYREVSPNWFDQSYRTFAPWTPEQVSAFESKTGVTLNDDVRQFFEQCDFWYLFDGNYSYEGCDHVNGNWDMMGKLLDDGTFDETWVTRVESNEGIPQEKIERAYWSKRWIPFGVDGCGNMYCADHGPAKNGVKGQVIAMECQDGQGPYLSEHASLTAFLEKHLWYFENGKFAVYDGDIEIDRWA